MEERRHISPSHLAWHDQINQTLSEGVKSHHNRCISIKRTIKVEEAWQICKDRDNYVVLHYLAYPIGTWREDVCHTHTYILCVRYSYITFVDCSSPVRFPGSAQLLLVRLIFLRHTLLATTRPYRCFSDIIYSYHFIICETHIFKSLCSIAATYGRQRMAVQSVILYYWCIGVRTIGHLGIISTYTEFQV